jgi:hypothetical protein
VNLFKEMSGYDVRKGYPRFMFTASVGSGVYSTSATAAIGMMLAAKDDNLPDCVSVPEKVEVPEEEMVEVEVTEEAAPASSLFSNEQMDEMVKQPEEKTKEKPTKTKTVKVHKPKKEGAGIFSIFWNTVVDGAIKVYDKANEEYKDQPANQE